MIAGNTVLFCGFGDVGMGFAIAMKEVKARCLATETEPVRALMAGIEEYQVATMETVLPEVDIFITATGICRVIRVEHMLKIKNNDIVGNMGHFNRKIDLESFRKYPRTKPIEVKPNIHRWVFQDEHSITILAEGRLLNVICGAANPRLVISIAFMLQVLTQVHLWKNRNFAQTLPTVCVPPRTIDTLAALYHLPCIDPDLTVSTNNPILSNTVLRQSS
ncbi:Adenosylhomocysteinase [Gracilariopsis chorda]|uniref:Adenosylhomocysteinase n=1 Tax=Gracilariopsis chorda TaxID=448386 RepID=A0A2V3IY50_9FLOR|nr:Adenosylhomocysteinase [Gracilariopsis chorda]|eukprot:PXF46060.1 Adenosylhomocysteinase [Gracilariopsis chorda]